MSIVDQRFCASSFLMYRYVIDKQKCFELSRPCVPIDTSFERTPIRSARDLGNALQETMKKAYADNKVALALSGGIDSAILARMAPPGTRAYTFRCLVEGKKVIDESIKAARWAQMNGLLHEVVDVAWDDLVIAIDQCMAVKGAPVHSIEGQIYIAAKRARDEGIERIVFGENADIIYGGMDGLLAKDWTYGQFVERYCYVMPSRVLREWEMPMEPFLRHERNGRIDGHEFVNDLFRQEALGTYNNACKAAGVKFVGPYSLTRLDLPIDYTRIRTGDTKYLVRELFRELYPGEEIPSKIPMPRATDQWLADWDGPIHPWMWPNCVKGMTGDQKWMVWCLERFLNSIVVSERS